MADAVVGSVSVDVVPSAEPFWREFEAQTRPGARKAGDDLGNALAPPIASSVRDAVEKGLSESGPAVKEQGKSQGASYGDAFDKEVISRLEAALKNLPDAVVDADTKPAEAKLAELKATLLGFTDAEYLKLDVDDATTLANLDVLRAELEELTGPEHDVRVRVNAGAAAAELAGLQVQIDKLSRSSSGGSGLVGAGDRDLAGIGAGASGAAGSIQSALLPALGAAAALLAGPVLAVGAGAFGTIALGAQGLETQLKTGLTPAFHDLEARASTALAPGFSVAIDNLQKALPQLNPLVDTFGKAIGQDAVDFTSWLNNGGLQGFVNYATTELPVVERLAKSAAGALGELVTSTQGQSNDVAGSLSGSLDTLTKLQQLRSKLEVPTNDSGIKGFGEGILGGLTGNFTAPAHSASILGGWLNTGYDDIFGGGGKKKPDPAVAAAAAAQAQQQAAALQAANAIGASVDSYQAASTAAQQLAGQTAASTLQMQLENNAAGLLSQALQGLGGDNLGVAQANTQFQTGLLTLGGTLTKNKDEIDGNSAAALANQAALQQQVKAAQDIYQATVQQTGSTKDGKAAYDAAITSIENATGATGKNKDAIDAYIGKIGEIPPVKATELDLETDAADKALAKYKQDLASVGLTFGALSQSDLLNNASVNVPGHAAGGMVGDGWFTAGEQGIELGYKSGSSVSFMNHAATMAVAQMPAAAPAAGQQPITITVQSILDGKVVATSVNEYNLGAQRR